MAVIYMYFNNDLCQVLLKKQTLECSESSNIVLFWNADDNFNMKLLELEIEFLSSTKKPILTYGTRVYMCS